MNRRLLRLFIMGGAVLFFAVAIMTFISYQRKPMAMPETILPENNTRTGQDSSFDKTVNCFFFSEGSNQMRSVGKRLQSGNRQDQIFQAFLELLLKGESGFILPLPTGTRIRSVFYLAEKKRLVIDFEEGLREHILKGTSAELTFIYFFVNNLCFNFKEIESVQFLIGGNEYETLAGHIVFDEPFFPDYSYLSGVNEQ